MGFRRIVIAVALLSALSAAAADSKRVFGSGRPMVFRESDVDRRFMRTRLARMLTTGTNEPACVELLGGLLTVVAEAAPYFHERDEQFKLDPALISALQTQLSTEYFSAQAYLIWMLRRIRLDGRLPLPWLVVAANINGALQTIDLGKLRLITEGVKPIDSAYFTLPLLRERYEAEVARANTATADSAFGEFRNAYLDHEVAFDGLSLLDLTVPPSVKDGTDLGALALAEWTPPDPNATTLSLETLKPRAKVRVRARLALRQFMDVSRLPKGSRVLLRGRLFDINAAGTEVELRDALLFEDRDWTQWALPANSAAIATCSAAINDIQGLGTPQPRTGMK